jgi:hypothetical protein
MELVDGIMSNFFISRKDGSKAEGIIKVEVDEQRNYFVAEGSIFSTTSELNYLVTQDYSIASDELFSISGSDNYFFFLNVIAEEVGSNYIVASGTIMETTILAGNLVRAETFNDFTGGVNQETNEELVVRAPTSLGTRDFSSRQSISSLLQEQFPSIRQITVVGYNNREMQRNKNNIGMKIGGPVDIYVRTATDPLTKTIEKTADSNGKIVLSDVVSGEVPLLRVRNFAKKTDPLTTYTSFSINIDSEQGEAIYYRFSIHEQIEVDVGEDYKNEDLILTIDYIPNIDDIQEYAVDEEVENLRSDSLVKSYMPCFVSMEIHYQATGDAVELEAQMTSELLNYINTYDQDILYVSKIIDRLHALNITNIILPLEITGTFYLPDGETLVVTSEDHIKIEDDYDLGVSKKTYRFFATPSDITLIKS